MIEALSDLETLSLTLYGEGRGEPIEAQVGIGSVIRNRGIKYKEICLAPYQFSCWNKDDPNYPLLLEIAQKLIVGQVIDDLAFDQCQWVAQGIIFNRLFDNTRGAKNYLTTKLFVASKPSWAKSPKQVKYIGNQVFLLI